MRIKYSKKRLYSSFFLGGIFALLALMRLVENPEHPWLYYIQLFLGLLGVGAYFYENHFQYLIIYNGILTKNTLKRKAIQLNKITRIKSFAREIKLFTSEEKLSINTQLIDNNSNIDLLKVLGSLEVKDNPFTSYSTKTS